MARSNKTPALPNFRVIQLTESERNVFKQHRENAGLNSENAIAAAVQDRLPKLMDALTTLGIQKQEGKRRPARLPISDATLALLHKASNATALPMVTILRVCLATKPSQRRKR